MDNFFEVKNVDFIIVDIHGEYAAEKIFEGLTKTKQFEIHFPKQLTLILKFLKILPNSWYLSLVGRLTKYQKR